MMLQLLLLFGKKRRIKEMFPDLNHWRSKKKFSRKTLWMNRYKYWRKKDCDKYGAWEFDESREK